MKKAKLFLLGLSLLICPTTLSSCSGFMSGGDNLLIESISATPDSLGNIVVVINFTDEERNPVSFIVPKGSDGTDGVGIKEITYSSSEDNAYTIIKVTYTDPNKEPSIFTVKNGEKGVSVTGISKTYDEEGNAYFYINFSDGTKSDPIKIEKGPKGDKGDDGKGIKNIETQINEDGSVDLTIWYTDDISYTEVSIPAPVKGETGRGIESMVATTLGDKYILTINYTDGTKDELNFDKPKDGIDGKDGKDGHTWLNGSRTPLDNEGNNGDYYFDILNKKIYFKRDGKWVLVISFDEQETLYTVSFNFNCKGDESLQVPGFEAPFSYQFKRGSYFINDTINHFSTLPYPTRNGYIFNGWCTSTSKTATSGIFTDLTPIMSDLTLYALWEVK